MDIITIKIKNGINNEDCEKIVEIMQLMDIDFDEFIVTCEEKDKDVDN